MKSTVLLLLLAATVAFSQPRFMNRGHQGARGMGREMGREMLAEKLNLTEDQKKEFGKIHTEFEKKQIGLHSKIKTMRLDLREIFQSDKPDRPKIESQISEISKLQNELKLNMVALWFDVNKMLTAEQQKIWKERPMLREGGKPPCMPQRGHGGKMGMLDEDPEAEE